jgi:hypothetical protein
LNRLKAVAFRERMTWNVDFQLAWLGQEHTLRYDTEDHWNKITRKKEKEGKDKKKGKTELGAVIFKRKQRISLSKLTEVRAWRRTLKK